MEIKAIILDCDGTMFDSERLWWDVWYEIGKSAGVSVPEDFLIRITGATSGKENTIQEDYPEVMGISSTVRKIGRERLDQIMKERSDIQKPGLSKLLDYIKEKQLKVAVVSNSETSHVHGLIQTTDYIDLFDCVVCREDVNQGKPNPEGLLKVAKQMQVNPENCLVIEDSKLGTLAAKNAGMHRIYIKDLVPKDEELQSYIEYELNDLTEVISFLEKNY